MCACANVSRPMRGPCLLNRIQVHYTVSDISILRYVHGYKKTAAFSTDQEKKNEDVKKKEYYYIVYIALFGL